MSILSGFSKSFKVDGEFLEVGGNWTCHRHVPEHHRREKGRVREGGVPPLDWWGGPPAENFEILDGRRCNLGKYLRKMKLLIGLKNAGFLG
jgi:hypothetical protein